MASGISIEYEKRRKTADNGLLDRKAEVYSLIPGINEIDREISRLGVKLAKKIILVASDKRDQYINSLNEEILMMKSLKEELLVQGGYDKNYLVPRYMCPDCNDTGYTVTPHGPEKCSCHIQLLIDMAYGQANIKAIHYENFGAFDETLFPDEINESRYLIKASPRQNILAIKDRCKTFIENFNSPEEKNLLFYGKPGVGKTFMINCIANELLSRRKTVLYQTSPELFNTVTGFRRKAVGDDEYSDHDYKRMLNVDLLIIDDLGIESYTESRYTELFSIINTRLLNNHNRPCKIIISTNLDIKDLPERYSERVFSRIAGSFNLFMFIGDDLRVKKRFSAGSTRTVWHSSPP